MTGVQARRSGLGSLTMTMGLCSNLYIRKTTVDEIAELKKENKKLKALLKTAVGLLQESKQILAAKGSAKPKKKKTSKKTGKKS